MGYVQSNVPQRLDRAVLWRLHWNPGRNVGGRHQSGRDPTHGSLRTVHACVAGSSAVYRILELWSGICRPIQEYTVKYDPDELFVDRKDSPKAVCNVEHPIEVQKPPTNISNYYNFADSAFEPACLSGKTYRVAAGDDCQTIATSQGVATGTLETINNIYPGCTNLIAGSTICLPQTCQTYLVRPGDTCWSIASAHGVPYSTFSGYNPTINGQCSNLLSGVNVCVSPAAGTYTPTTVAGATVTQVGVYATTTIMPPSPTPFGTTAQCGRYYQAQSGDYCQQISLNNSISVPLFEKINPSINDDCTNLNPGFYYCVFPTQDWSQTSSGASSVTVGAPAPTPSGTTNACYTWHTVKQGDYCAKLEQQYRVTLAQLQLWNPQLNAACDNLLLGDAYCVLGK
ncbi:MAG: hypothetical protein Q9199_001853 [Rusavskia elegans]